MDVAADSARRRGRVWCRPVASPSPDDDRPARTRADLLAVTGGRVALLGGWFVTTFVLARVLGIRAYGRYTLATTAIRLVTGLTGDPLDAAVMRSAPLHVRADRPRALAVVRSAFALRGAVGLATVAVATAVPWAASRAVFHTVDHRRLAVLTAAGVLGDLLLRSALGYFQVARTFGRFLAVDVVWQVGRTGAVLALLATGRATAAAAVAVYVAAPYAAFAVALLLLPGDVRRPVRPARADVAAVWHAAKWVAAATAAGTVYELLNPVLLGWLRGEAAVGVYGLAMTLAAVPDFLDGGVQTVLAPRVAPAFAAGRFGALNRQYLTWAVPIGLAAAVVAVGLGGWGIRTFASNRYAGSVPVFRLLVLGTLFTAVVTPLPAALLNYVAPRWSAAVTAVGLAIVAGGGLLVIPRHGAVGAAAVVLAARVVVGTAVAVLALQMSTTKVRRGRRKA